VVQTIPPQPPAPTPVDGGLPFWLLWFLLCVILLLVAFIFLRDKDLRRRVSSFLSGARRHMSRLRLQVRLKREKEKKAGLWRELGKLAWSEDVRASCIEEPCTRLAVFEEEIGRHRKTWHEVYSRIEVLGRAHDEALTRFRCLVAEQEEARRPHQGEMVALAGRKREILDALEATLRETEDAEIQLRAVEKDARTIAENPKLAEADRTSRLERIRQKAASLADAVRALRERTPVLQEERYRLDRRLEEVEGHVRVFNAAIQRIDEEYRARLQALEKEIREWQRAKERVQDKIVDIKRLMEPVFETTGRSLDEARVGHEDLAVLYFQIDGVDRTIADLEARLERLK
jgi:chromosome segregation ATPase